MRSRPTSLRPRSARSSTTWARTWPRSGRSWGPTPDLAAFTARLGTPQAYAAELRAAAGYPAAPRAAVASGEGAALFALAALLGSTALVLLGSLGFLVGNQVPTVRRAAASVPDPDSTTGKVVAFVVSLQPAWWLLRAVLAATVLTVPFQLQPEVGSILLLSLLFVPLSVWLGFRSQADRRLLWLVVPLNTFAGLVALLVPVAFTVFAASSGATSSAPPYLPGLWQDGERQIEDIRPVDAAGVPLSGVYPFDQDGWPIDTGDLCGEGSVTPADPARPYPRGTVGYDDRTGECVVVPPGPLVVAVPSAGPTTAPPTSVEIGPVPLAPGGSVTPTTQAPPTGCRPATGGRRCGGSAGRPVTGPPAAVAGRGSPVRSRSSAPSSCRRRRNRRRWR